MVLFKKREISRKWDHGSGSSVHGQILKTKKKKKDTRPFAEAAPTSHLYEILFLLSSLAHSSESLSMECKLPSPAWPRYRKAKCKNRASSSVSRLHCACL